MYSDQEEPGCAMAVMVNPVAAVDGQVYDDVSIVVEVPSWDLPNCVQE